MKQREFPFRVTFLLPSLSLMLKQAVGKSKTPHESHVAAMIAFLIDSGTNGGALSFDLEKGRGTAICFSFLFNFR